jgi:hypothetical protein
MKTIANGSRQAANRPLRAAGRGRLIIRSVIAKQRPRRR